MNKLFSLFSSVLATMIAAPVIAQLPCDCGQWDASQFGYGLNPPVYCPAECAGNLGVYGDFIYFRASEDDTIAYQVGSYLTTPSVTTPTTDVVSRDFYRHKFCPNWKPGYRVGLWYQLPCDQWTIDANYTYFYSKTTRNSDPQLLTVASSVTVDPGFTTTGSIVGLPYNLYVTSEAGFVGDVATHVGSTWQLRFNQVDVDLTREFYVGPQVTFRPYVGFRGQFIQQHVNSTGSTIVTGAVTGITDDYSTITTQNLTCNSDGYGLHGGSELTFGLFDGFSLFGNVGISLLWTHFNTQFQRLALVTTTVGPAFAPTSFVVPNKEAFDVIRFGADLSAGIQWRMLFNCNQNEFFLRFAWEHHIYMNQNAFRTYVDGAVNFEEVNLGGLINSHGDLALYGFSIRAGFSF